MGAWESRRVKGRGPGQEEALSYSLHRQWLPSIPSKWTGVHVPPPLSPYTPASPGRGCAPHPLRSEGQGLLRGAAGGLWGCRQVHAAWPFLRSLGQSWFISTPLA